MDRPQYYDLLFENIDFSADRFWGNRALKESMHNVILIALTIMWIMDSDIYRISYTRTRFIQDSVMGNIIILSI